MNKKKSKTHYQRGEHEVVEELTLDRHERRVEDATRKEKNVEEGSRDARRREDEEEKGTKEGDEEEP